MNDHLRKSLHRTRPWPFGRYRAECFCGRIIEGSRKQWVLEAMGDHVWSANVVAKMFRYRSTKSES